TIAPPRTVLRAFARVDPFPSIAGPAPPSVPPDRRVLSSAAVTRAHPSVVRITATACGLGVEGSGWIAGPHLVVTAAHVVAGASGGPAVNGRGQVEATVFAARIGAPGGYGVPAASVRAALARAKRPVSTGSC